MKQTLLFISALLIALPMVASAQDETVLETQHSGCLGNTRGYMDEWVPAIVLEKEGSVLTVEVQNYISNCATSDFVVKSSISGGNDGEPLTLSAEVQPVLGELLADCLCPFNVTFTVRDLEANSFYLNCEWYKGQVELTDGEPLVLKKEDVVIDETNFPDEYFRQYVSEQNDKNHDGLLDQEEISEAMSMFVFDGKIDSMKGIEFFTALQQLYCTGTQIESLDLSKCVALTTLECYDNSKLSTLNVSGCKALTSLNCSGGQLTSLEITDLASLTSLNCNNNALTSLDVTHNAELRNLRCSGNRLTGLDVTRNEELVELYCIDNQLTSLDVSKNTKLSTIYCYTNHLNEVNMGEFVESLPVVLVGNLIVTNIVDSKEKNEINTEQAEAANAKGWIVRDVTGKYYGNDPTQVPQDIFSVRTIEDVEMWFTVTSEEGKTCQVKSNQAIPEQTEGHVTIPSEANGYTVTGIGQSAFHGCNKMTGISIPETVTSIEADAFSSCSSLNSVIIPNSVREVGNNAFYGCSGLSSVTLSGSMYEISGSCFMECASLTSVTIPENISVIGPSAFAFCSSLNSVSIPDWVETIGGLAFEGCTSLASISLPNSLQLLGNGAFHNCSSLTSITIPDGVYRIDSYTFNSCSSLTSVTIGSGVGSIESNAFSECKALKDISCLAETVPNTKTDAFDVSAIGQMTLHVPKSAIEAYRSTKPWSDFGTIREIELDGINGVKAIANDSPYYSLGGFQSMSPSKGINIIRQSDGTTRKVIVK